MNNNYLFTSARLGFRNWQDSDIVPFAEMCADPEVMEFFPALLSLEETTSLVQRLSDQFDKHATTFFAVDKLEDRSFIGFIGMLHKKESCDFAPVPCMEIGWRLKRSSWGKGYATEGAKRCLNYCKEALNCLTVYSITPIPNVKSEHIMQKIGMTKTGEFNHPGLEKGTWLEQHVIYKIDL